MRVERATLGKSITDGWLELRLLNIVYSSSRTWEYICVLKFKSLKFFPGYVGSYEHYLGLNPDKAFATFCVRTGFSLCLEQQHNIMVWLLN